MTISNSTEQNTRAQSDETISIDCFLKDGPFKVSDVTKHFPLLSTLSTNLEIVQLEKLKCDGITKSHVGLQTNYKIESIKTSSYPNIDCIKEYTPSFKRYVGSVRNCQTGHVLHNQPCFFKITSVYDSNALVNDTYKDLGKRFKKVNFAQNTAYTDSLASYLTSKLVETEICPHFPHIYGVYNGTIQKHYVEFTEEYYDHRRKDSFKKGLLENRWKMVPEPNSSSDSDYESDSENDAKNETDEYDSSDALTTQVEQLMLDAIHNLKEKSHKTSSDTSLSEKSSIMSNDHLTPLDIDSCTTFDQNELESVTNEEGESILTPCKTRETGLSDNLLIDNQFVSQLETVQATLTHHANAEDQPLYLEMHDVPVQIVAMQAFDHVMEDHLKKDYTELKRLELLYLREKVYSATWCAYRWIFKSKHANIEKKWIALFCQVCVALIAMQHQYNMIHNDLHAQNILLETTELTHLLYKIDHEYYRVPTCGYIIKIIDMGRTTFCLNGIEYMGDVFHPVGEAGEQYTYIHAKDADTMGESKVVPNPAFDLSRLACSILDEFYGGCDRFAPNVYGISIPEDDPNVSGDDPHDWIFEGQKKTVSPLYNMLCEWISDMYNEPINRYEFFDLYKSIARQMQNTNPLTQMRRPHFAQYKTNDTEVRTDEKMYHVTKRSSDSYKRDGYHSDTEVNYTKQSSVPSLFMSMDSFNSSDDEDDDKCLFEGMSMDDVRSDTSNLLSLLCAELNE